MKTGRSHVQTCISLCYTIMMNVYIYKRWIITLTSTLKMVSF